MTVAAAAYRQPSAPNPDAELLRKHADLVRRIAYHLVARLPASVEVDDLIQAGLMGLMEASRHYSETAGASFETFASIRIRGAMIDEIRKGDWAPRSVHRRARDAAAAIRRIEQASGHEAAATDIAAAMGISLEDYHQIAGDAARSQVMSLHRENGEEDESSRIAAPAGAEPLSRLEKSEFAGALAQAIDGLPEREKQIMALYYQEELNLKEIGAVLGVTESRVCQLHGQALMRLRARLKDWREDGE